MKTLNYEEIASKAPYPLTTVEERLCAWKNAAGIWKNRKPSPIKELKKMRQQWDRHFAK